MSSHSDNLSNPSVRNILIGVTGSVATIKLPHLVRHFLSDPTVEVKVVTTKHARHFFNKEDLPNSCEVLGDEDEWKMWNKMQDPVLHIELRNWADMLVIAPLDANTLSKCANGLCDNLLTCIIRAWDITRPIVIAPAMNTNMWSHPFTARHLNILTKEFGYHVVQPVSKKLACGDVGVGGMADPLVIVNTAKAVLDSSVGKCTKTQ
ncbi:uncharacterized protein VTP21DRAFT_6467 [Calcarisporiella thermophila]|uniref:uncharacterized protein n=1 Tax=Calcarisporiella thermophila TaxID=911321 RepID=UPI00374233AA